MTKKRKRSGSGDGSCGVVEWFWRSVMVGHGDGVDVGELLWKVVDACFLLSLVCICRIAGFLRCRLSMGWSDGGAG